MSERVDLNFVLPEDDGETLALTTRVWSNPEIPTLREKPPRLKHAIGWTPFRSHVLVRTVDQITGAYDAVLGNAHPGSAIHFHLGCVSEQPLPETRRLVKVDDRFITLAEHERLSPAMTSLGFIGTVPFPMLDALELRRTSDGQDVLVAGAGDPLGEGAEHIGTLGFVEPFPLRPRQAPGSIGRALRPLWRWFDPVVERHRYGCPLAAPAGAVCLGSLQTVLDPFGLGARDGEGYVPLQLSDISQATPGVRILVWARWTAAPLTWRTVGKRQRIEGAAQRAREAITRTPSERHDDTPIGYLRSGPAPQHSALYAAAHPITGDLFLTRSAQEAGDMGYGGARPLGWIADDRADRRPGRDRIWWASRFGQFRRYREETWRHGADDTPLPPSDGHAHPATALVDARSAAGLANLGIAPGETKTVMSAGGGRALIVAVTPSETSLLAIVAASHERCAERCRADYVVVSLLDPSERGDRLAELNRRYSTVYLLDPDVLLGPDADPFSDPDRGFVRSSATESFADRRQRLLAATSPSAEVGGVAEISR